MGWSRWLSSENNVAGANSRILDLGGADPVRAGSYSVTVTNGDGTAASAPASLIVDRVSYWKWLSQVPNATNGATFEPTGGITTGTA